MKNIKKTLLRTIYTGSGASSNTMADKSIADWYLRWHGFCGTCCDSTNTEFCLHRAYVGWAVKTRLRKQKKYAEKMRTKKKTFIYDLWAFYFWFRILNMRYEFLHTNIR